jgi:tetratricopeptide (TPR) repeat protein
MTVQGRLEAAGRSRSAAAHACLLGALAWSTLAGCVTTPAAQVKADMAVMKQEGGPDKLIDRGNAFAAVGDTTRAEQYYAAAITSGADERKVMPLLLTVCAQDGRYRVAIQYAEGYLKGHPSDLRVRFVLGTLYAAVNEPDLARVALGVVVDARPEDADAHFALGVVLRDSDHDYAGADRQFREYIRLKPRGSHAEEAQASLLKSVP